MAAIVESVKSRHVLGVLFERVVFRMKDYPVGMVERLKPWAATLLSNEMIEDGDFIQLHLCPACSRFLEKCDVIYTSSKLRDFDTSTLSSSGLVVGTVEFEEARWVCWVRWRGRQRCYLDIG